MDERRTAQWLGVATAVVVLLVLFDVGRRSLRSLTSPPPPPPVPSLSDTTASDSTPPTALAPGTGSQRGAAVPFRERSPSYMEQVGRADLRRQIRASAGRTYLNEIVAASADSMLHRWDDRQRRPVRVYLPTTSRTANFQPVFLESVRAAFRAWSDVGLPVSFDLSADSATAEVRFRWRVQFEEERTGQTDLEWDGDGRVLGADVILATFDPDGRPMHAEGMRVVALHEIGHVLGLDHSPDDGDLMHPVAKVGRLSRRDEETARLLYRLTPGSLR
jgi:hypothetical protein